MRTLRKVNIEGFKSIAKQTLELNDLNVVIGPNGSGKSNLIGVFRLLNRVLSKNLQLYVAEQGGADRFLHHGRKHTPSLEVGFDFAQNAYGFRLKPALGDSLIFETESVAGHFAQPSLADRMRSMLTEAGEAELINGDPATHLKVRIRNLVPTCKEVADGATLLGKIGIEPIRAACPHFAQRLARLENLASAEA